MTLLLGCIADDITGATDLALMLGRNGMPAVQYIGLPETDTPPPDTPAAVVALKSRTAPADDAVAESRRACQWLLKQGAEQIFFKYCSTFDSTDTGNIGPVAEALLAETGAKVTIVCPAFPVNRRTVYMGHLFVEDRLLSESGMRHHPLTPMIDPDLVRVLGRQVAHPESVGLLPLPVLEKGEAAIRNHFSKMAASGVRFAVTDALTDGHLKTLGAACKDFPLITGGSGVAMGLPENFRKAGRMDDMEGAAVLPQLSGHGAVLSGSCSLMTQKQVQVMGRNHESLALSPLELADGSQTPEKMIAWAKERLENDPVLIYSTAASEDVAAVQKSLGREAAGELVEQALAEVALGLRGNGLRKLVVAGGETSGAVLKQLEIRKLRIGPEIAPGVPWTLCEEGDPLLLALKSGNFGTEDFFEKALEMVS